MFRWWAFWRRVQYGLGFFVLLGLVVTSLYFVYWYTPASCFDGMMNGDERGIDCGGACARVCSADIVFPTITWAESFRIVEGQYNAVAYVENPNGGVGTPKMEYTFRLFDDAGLITERKGTTQLPPHRSYPIFEGRISTGSRIPTRTELVLNEDAIWLPVVETSAQFSVLMHTLTSADAAPRLTAEVRNDDLARIRDVEVVATIFDSKRTPLTASRTIVQDLPGRSDQTIVFTWPEPIASTLRSCEVPTDVVLAIDLSGSMNNDSVDPPQPLTGVLDAARSFVARLKTHDQSGVVTYATGAQIAQPLTQDAAAVAELIGKLAIDPREETGNTNTGEALKSITAALSSAAHNDNARKVAILLTDGLATAPGNDPEAYARTQAELLKKEGIQLFTVGLGESLNEEFLRELATTPDHYYRAPSLSEVDRIYGLITEAICEDGPSMIEIVPKTEATFSGV